MKTNTILFLGAGALLLIYLGNLGVAGNVLQYYISAVDFTGLTTGRIVLVVQNPSNASILLNSMAGTITCNGTTLGNVSNFQGGVTIPANQQTQVTIQVALSLTGIMSQLYAALTNPTGTNKLTFVIQGNANINGGMEIPFNITQDVLV